MNRRPVGQVSELHFLSMTTTLPFISYCVSCFVSRCLYHLLLQKRSKVEQEGCHAIRWR